LHHPQGQDVGLVRYLYDETQNLAEVINSSNRALHFDYDVSGRVSKWTDRNGQWYRYFYDEHGRCVANQGSGGFLNGSFAYDTESRTTRFTDALGHTTTYRYNERRANRLHL
jgi:YD repeat-containing protein